MIAHELEKRGYGAWMRNVIRENSGDIDYDFMGFTEIYRHLSKVIPQVAEEIMRAIKAVDPR